jgi:FkbM family methyltransferase
LPQPADSLIEQLARHEELRHAVGRLVSGVATAPAIGTSQPVDVVVTPNEMNERHGTGVLVKRVFAGCSGIVSVRARNDYGGDHSFGERAVVLPQKGLSRADSFRRVLDMFDGRAVRRVVCVPFVADDLVTSIALHDAFGARLAIWIMDDQNVAVPGIPDALMREALEKCALRLTTHPEMRQAYEKKFGLRFDLLPAVVPGGLVRETPSAAPAGGPGALVGSLWARDWFERLCRTVSRAGHPVDWFGNHLSPYLHITPEELQAAGIHAHGIVAEPELASALRSRSFAIVPTGTLDGDTGTSRALAELSLPGRILFVAATSHTPMIVLGSEQTPAARFVRRFDIGLCSPYDPDAFRAAVEEVVRPEVQARMRSNAARVARTFSADGIGEWLWGSLEKGEPADDRFERLLPRGEDELVPFIEPPAPPTIYREYVPIYHALRRLRGRGVRIDFVVDVGASVGIWSYAASRVYPEAQFVLADPLTSRYSPAGREFHVGSIARCVSEEVAVSSRAGRTTLRVPPDLYGASLLDPADFRRYEPIEVSVTTVDALAAKHALRGRGLLKADVQFAEHLVLEGARDTLPLLDVIVLELSLARYHPEAKTFVEMVNALDALGFRYFDDAGVWRSPADGLLLQKDVVFVRRGVCDAPTSEGADPTRASERNGTC